MTISKEEFDRGKLKDEQYKAIEKYLKEKPNNAHTFEEILKNALKRDKPNPSLELPALALDLMSYVALYLLVDKILNEMISESKIASKIINGDRYFKWK
jgi:hypothetical protein